MRRDPRVFLWDALNAANRVVEFTTGVNEAGYMENAMLRSAVERQLEILGEALAQLEKNSPEVASRVTELRSAVDLRNVLIHGYAKVNDRTIWNTVQWDLPRMARELSDLLGRLDE